MSVTYQKLGQSDNTKLSTWSAEDAVRKTMLRCHWFDWFSFIAQMSPFSDCTFTAADGDGDAGVLQMDTHEHMAGGGDGDNDSDSDTYGDVYEMVAFALKGEGLFLSDSAQDIQTQVANVISFSWFADWAKHATNEVSTHFLWVRLKLMDSPPTIM